MGRGARRAGIVTGLALTTAAAAVPVAHAAQLTVDRRAGVVTFTAGAGEANHLTVSYDPTRAELVFKDSGATVAFTVSGGAANSCRSTKIGIVCTAPGLTVLNVVLGDGDDSFAAAGLPARVTLTCGAGEDSVASDSADSVDASCEGGGDPSEPTGDQPDPHEDAGTTTDPGSGSADPDVPTDANGVPVPAPDIVLPVRPVTLGEPGIVQVELGCSAGAAAVCSGDIYVTAPARHFVRADGGVSAARGRHQLRQRRLGHRRFRVAPGKLVTASVPVLRGHYVMRNRRKRVRGRVLVVQRDASGKVLGTTARPVVLERKWSRRDKTRRHR